MGQQTLISPKQRWSRAKAKKRQFPIVDFEERLGVEGGGGVYKFVIYFVQDCRSYLRIRWLK